MSHDQQNIEEGAQHAHAHHRLARLFEREYESDEQPSHQRSTPHHGDGVGRQCACDDAAALEVGDHPAVDALLGGVLEKQKTGEHPEPRRTKKAPINGLFSLGVPGLAAAQRGKDVHQPEHKAHGCQQKDRQFGAYPGCCRNEEGAQQCTAGVAAVHQIHAPGAVGRIVADQNGAGVDDTALSDSNHKKGRCQQNFCSRQPHDAVACRVADGQQQHAGFHAQHAGQHSNQKPRQQVAHAHQRKQGTGHAIGKAVPLLQQADDHARADGADTAEEEGQKACIAQARRLLFHNRPLSVKISSLYLTIIPHHCNRIFLQKRAKSSLGHGRFEMPSACALGIIQGNITLDFGRTERLRMFRSAIFTRKVAEMRCIFPSQPLS